MSDIEATLSLWRQLLGDAAYTAEGDISLLIGEHLAAGYGPRGQLGGALSRRGLTLALTFGAGERVGFFAARRPPRRVEAAAGEAALVEAGDRRFLLASARAESGPLPARLRALEVTLREVSSQERLKETGLSFGFRPEDVVVLSAGVIAGEEEEARRWLARRFLAECELTVAPASETGLVAAFAERGKVPTSQRARYEREGDKIRVEALELHVAEHCNLRCAHCCN